MLHKKNINDAGKLSNESSKGNNTIESRPHCKLPFSFNPPPNGYISAFTPMLSTSSHKNTEKEAGETSSETSKLINESNEPSGMMNSKEKEHYCKYLFPTQSNLGIKNAKYVDEVTNISSELSNSNSQEHTYNELPPHFKFKPPPNGYVSSFLPFPTSNFVNDGVNVSINISQENTCSYNEVPPQFKLKPPPSGYVSAFLPLPTTNFINEGVNVSEIKGSVEASKEIEIKGTNHLCSELSHYSKFKPPNGYVSAILPTVKYIEDEIDESAELKMFQNYGTEYVTLPQFNKGNYTPNFLKNIDNKGGEMFLGLPNVYEDTCNSYLPQNFDSTYYSIFSSPQLLTEKELSSTNPQVTFQNVKNCSYNSENFSNTDLNEENYQSTEPKFGYSVLSNLIPVNKENEFAVGYTLLETTKGNNEKISEKQFSSEIKYSEPKKEKNEAVKLFSLSNEKKESKNGYILLSNFS